MVAFLPFVVMCGAVVTAVDAFASIPVSGSGVTAVDAFASLPQTSAVRFCRQVPACSVKMGMKLSRRDALAAALVLLPLRSAEAKKEVSSAKGDGVTALSGADPADKKRLEDAAAIIESLEESLQDPNKWQSVIDTVTKAPFNKDSMEQMFTKAAKLLPPNIQKIYGGDGGQWVGLKTEAVDAMDALSAELTFLEGERKKSGKVPADTGDLFSYYALLKEKTQGFLALYANNKLNSQLKGGGFCAYSSSAKCDDYDDSADVKEAIKAGADYNSLRLGK